MKRYDKVTPEGTKDYLFDECGRRSRVTGILKNIFRARGYRRVMTPTIEFYDVFGASAAYLPQENMYKLMDQKGRLMVLCPDGTIPIARLAVLPQTSHRLLLSVKQIKIVKIISAYTLLTRFISHPAKDIDLSLIHI